MFPTLTLLVAALAQESPAALSPAESALRARVQQFYDAFVEGKYRKAYALVADDSQDHFLEMGKPEVKAFRIQRTELTEGGTRAAVTIELDTEFRFSGQSVPVKRQLDSTWRLENGEWLWYYVPPKQVRTPFGVVTVDPDARKRQVDLKEQIAKGAKPADLMGGLKVVPAAAAFPADAPGAQTFTVTNSLPGWINLSVMVPKVGGLKVPPFDRPLGPGQSRTIQLIWEPGQAVPPQDSVEFVIQASPIGGAQVIPVTWKRP